MAASGAALVTNYRGSQLPVHRLWRARSCASLYFGHRKAAIAPNLLRTPWKSYMSSFAQASMVMAGLPIVALRREVEIDWETTPLMSYQDHPASERHNDLV